MSYILSLSKIDCNESGDFENSTASSANKSRTIFISIILTEFSSSVFTFKAKPLMKR